VQGSAPACSPSVWQREQPHIQTVPTTAYMCMTMSYVCHCLHMLHCTSAGQTDVKAVVDQEIAQEIARLEAKIDAVISTRLLAHDSFACMVL